MRCLADRRHLLLFSLVIITVAGVVILVTDVGRLLLRLLPSSSNQDHRTLVEYHIRKGLEAEERNFIFVGRVVYGTGQAVPGAEVLVQLHSIYGPDGEEGLGTPPHKIRYTTDQDGYFVIIDSAQVLRILNIKGSGVWLYDREAVQRDLRVPGNTGYSLSHTGGTAFYMPKRDNPAIFVLLRPDEVIKAWPSRGGEDSYGKAGTVVNTPLQPNRPSVPLVETDEGWVYSPNQ